MGNGASSSTKDNSSSPKRTTQHRTTKRTSTHDASSSQNPNTAHQVTKIETFEDNFSEVSSNAGDLQHTTIEAPLSKKSPSNRTSPDAASKLKSLNAIKEAFSSPEPDLLAPKSNGTQKLSDLTSVHRDNRKESPTGQQAAQNVVKFHRTDPQWRFDASTHLNASSSFPQATRDFTEYIWQGMQKVHDNLWIVELLRERDLLDEHSTDERLAVMLQMDPNHEKYLSMQGMLCMFGEKLDVRMPRVILIDSSNQDEYHHVLNQIEEVAGSSLQEAAKSSESLLIYEFLPKALPLDASLFEDNISHPAFRQSLADIMAFDILVNNQSHIPCIVATKGHPENLVVSTDTHHVIPIENKTIILSAQEDIEVYCANVEQHLRNPVERRQNIEDSLKRFCKNHLRLEDVHAMHLAHVCQCFEERLRRFALLDEQQVLQMLEDIASAYPSVASQLKPQFYVRVQQTMREVVE